MFDGLATVLIQGPTDDHVVQATEMVESGVTEMERRLQAPAGTVFPPLVLLVDDDLNDDVIEGDLLAQTVLKHAEDITPGSEQRMTSTEWLHHLSRLYSGDGLRPLPKGWPTTGKVLSDRLKRLQPTLAARGVLIDSGRTREGRYLEMARPAAAPPEYEQPEMN